jgi:hypothetical protein
MSSSSSSSSSLVFCPFLFGGELSFSPDEAGAGLNAAPSSSWILRNGVGLSLGGFRHSKFAADPFAVAVMAIDWVKYGFHFRMHLMKS